MLVSVVIPSLNRKDSLDECLRSLHGQTHREYEEIVVTEAGELAQVRNAGISRANGDIITIIDDDVCLPATFLESVVRCFETFADVGGVTGPTIMSKEALKSRDRTKHTILKRFYDWLFLDGMEHLPARITKSGATTDASNYLSMYEGEVDYGEACNMSWKGDVIRKLGGFDTIYGGCGDYSEPDLAMRVRAEGGRIWYSSDCGLFHNPSRRGAFSRRIGDRTRYTNFLHFSNRWIKPNWKNELYKLFLRAYLKI